MAAFKSSEDNIVLADHAIRCIDDQDADLFSTLLNSKFDKTNLDEQLEAMKPTPPKEEPIREEPPLHEEVRPEAQESK